jgi:MoaA/NifB/PqqE/SkfB family radical SAM enzyme
VTPLQAANLSARAGVRPPTAITVAITGRCNLLCDHCWVESGTRASAGHVPAEAVIRLAERFAALGGDTIWITGGEPLAHPSWAAILAGCCAQRTLRTVGLQTNGTLVDDDAVEALRALPRRKLLVQVSLDGESARTHDRVRGRRSFDATMRGLGRLAAAGLGKRTRIAFTEMRHNMEDIPELLRLVDDLGLEGLVGGTFVRAGRAAHTGLEPPTAAGPSPRWSGGREGRRRAAIRAPSSSIRT